MKKPLLFVILTLVMSACAPNVVTTAPEGTPTAENTAKPTLVPTDTSTPSPTDTPTPTATATEVSSPTPDVINEIVSILTEDEISIVGSLFGEGEVAVILTHMGEAGSNTRASWLPFARHVAARDKVTALAIDLRGYGSSAGERMFNQQYLDVLAAIKFLKQRGYTKIVCMGASMGGNACADAAVKYPNLTGLAIIASNPKLSRDYSDLMMPKLFVLEEGDPYALKNRMETVYEMMAEPKEYHTFPEDVHGTRMFETPSGDAFRQLLVAFLESFAD